MSIYSDINTSKTEKFPLVSDIDSVWQAFENFMLTHVGERFFRPTFGSPLRKTLLFELEYEDAVLYALTRLTEAIELWDPRIEITDDTTVEFDYDNQIVKLNIVFRVKGFENQVVRGSISL